MSHTLASPNATTTLRQWCVRLWNDPDARSTLIGVAAVILFHLLLWLVGPLILRVEAVPLTHRPHATPSEFNIELTPETLLRPAEKPPEPFKFVETNPDAPENTPDETVNFSSQNQQVAQEKATPEGTSDRPALEGKKDFESNQIVSGRLTTPLEHLPAVPPSPEVPPTPEQAVTAPHRTEQNPLPGFEKIDGENQDAVGSNVARQPDNAKPIPERIEGGKVPLIEGAVAMQPTIDRNRPQPRPQLTRTVQARPAILAQNNFGTKNIGPTAVDARWSQYGEYLKRMIDTVQIQWERIIVQWNANAASNSSVTVKFVMDAEGRIAQIVNVDSTANETASRACVSAIADPAPYGPWTDDMKAVLGDKQEMTFTFYYQ